MTSTAVPRTTETISPGSSFTVTSSLLRWPARS
jgi:hypothetical protein